MGWIYFIGWGRNFLYATTRHQGARGRRITLVFELFQKPLQKSETMKPDDVIALCPGWSPQRPSEFLAGISWKSTSKTPGESLLFLNSHGPASCSNPTGAHSVTTSWTTCWSRSRRRSPVFLGPGSPSTSPRSSSTALWWSSTASVGFSWVSPFSDVWKWVQSLGLNLFWLFRGTSVHRGTAGQTEDVQENRYGGSGEVRALVQGACTRYNFHGLHHVLVCVRQVLDMPDALSLLEETEGASDPLFGVMRDAWLSPSTFTKVPWSKNTKLLETCEKTQDRQEILT